MDDYKKITLQYTKEYSDRYPFLSVKGTVCWVFFSEESLSLKWMYIVFFGQKKTEQRETTERSIPCYFELLKSKYRKALLEKSKGLNSTQ